MQSLVEQLPRLLQVADTAFGYTYPAAGVLFASLVLLRMNLGILGGLVGGSRDGAHWAGLVLLCGGIYGVFEWLFDGFVNLSQDAASLFMAPADLARFWMTWEDRMEVLAGGVGDSVWDFVFGLGKAGLLTATTVASHHLALVGFYILFYLACGLLVFLKVVGPFLVVSGVFADGKTLKEWLFVTLQVSLWPALPPFFVMLIVQGSRVFATDNVVIIITQNLAFAFFALATPLIVHFILGRSGFQTFLAGAGIAVSTGIVRLGARVGAKASSGVVHGHAARVLQRPFAAARRHIGKEPTVEVDEIHKRPGDQHGAR